MLERKLTKREKLMNLYYDVTWKIMYFFVEILERLFRVVK